MVDFIRLKYVTICDGEVLDNKFNLNWAEKYYQQRLSFRDQNYFPDGISETINAYFGVYVISIPCKFDIKVKENAQLIYVIHLQ